MGVEIACDVEECDSRAPSTGEILGVPHGWIMMFKPPDELAMIRARKALVSDPSDMLAMGPMGPQKIFICGKHPLPKLKGYTR